MFLGLLPLIFMWGVASFGNEPTRQEMNHLIAEGLFLFVCCAVMGAVLIDMIVSKIKLTKIAVFALIVAPIGAYVLMLIIYLLNVVRVVKYNYFGFHSKLTMFMLIFSFVYCTLAKASLLSSEQSP